jgi:hypothetical protein
MRVAFALLLLIHGVAHLVDFVVSWQIATLKEMPYKTTILANSINVGDSGIRLIGILWLVAALVFAACSIGALTHQAWWSLLTLWIAAFSCALCVIGWPDARLGVFVNIAIVVALSLMPVEDFRSVRSTSDEQVYRLPGDDLISTPITSLTHAITIQRAPRDVWPWIAQMGAGTRAGWYSYDFFDNGRKPSANTIVSELQHIETGMIFPAVPGAKDGFIGADFEPERFLILGWPSSASDLLH